MFAQFGEDARGRSEHACYGPGNGAGKHSWACIPPLSSCSLDGHAGCRAQAGLIEEMTGDMMDDVLGDEDEESEAEEEIQKVMNEIIGDKFASAGAVPTTVCCAQAPCLFRSHAHGSPRPAIRLYPRPPRHQQWLLALALAPWLMTASSRKCAQGWQRWRVCECRRMCGHSSLQVTATLQNKMLLGTLAPHHPLSTARPA